MANQPKKYKKFVATAATATLVASAIVPVASAASFSDVPENNEFAPYIDALTEAGIINGYPSTNTFKPGAALTRGQVVKMLGRWVESNGVEIPSDWNTKARFTDVPTNHKDQELVKYAALVADEGVFGGAAGKLMAGNNITRQQMAKVLNGAYAAVNGESLIEIAEGVDNVRIPDLASARAEFEDAIQALMDLEISSTNSGNFRPLENVTRAQFSKFLYNTINFEAVDVAPFEVKAINNTTVEVIFENDIENIDNVKFEIDGLKVTNAVVKQTSKRTAVLTTESQKGGTEYTVKVDGEQAGTFIGVEAVIPTAIDIVEKSQQNIVGNQVTVQAKVTVAEGQSKAGIPVTFNIVNNNGLNTSNLNQPIVAEALTDENGVATYTYTRYAQTSQQLASSDEVQAYATGKPALRSFAKVYWASVQPLTISEVTTGNSINNGGKKVYKVTAALNHAEAKTVGGVTKYYVNVGYLENINVTPDKAVKNVTVTDSKGANLGYPGQFTTSTAGANAATKEVEIELDSKGEATFTLTGSNATVTPFVFVDQNTNPANAAGTLARFDETELVAKAPAVTFAKTQTLGLNVTAEGVQGAAAYATTSTPTVYDAENTGGRNYKATLTNLDGKTAQSGTPVYVSVKYGTAVNKNDELANVYLWDNNAETVTKLSYSNGSPVPVRLLTDKNGQVSFKIIGEKDSYATPTVYTETGDKVGLDSNDLQQTAEIVYFGDAVVNSAKLLVGDKESTSVVVNRDAEFIYQTVDQNGNAYVSATDFVVSFEVSATFSPANVSQGQGTFVTGYGPRTVGQGSTETFAVNSTGKSKASIKVNATNGTQVSVKASASQGTFPILSASATFTNLNNEGIEAGQSVKGKVLAVDTVNNRILLTDSKGNNVYELTYAADELWVAGTGVTEATFEQQLQPGEELHFTQKTDTTKAKFDNLNIASGVTLSPTATVKISEDRTTKQKVYDFGGETLTLKELIVNSDNVVLKNGTINGTITTGKNVNDFGFDTFTHNGTFNHNSGDGNTLTVKNSTLDEVVLAIAEHVALEANSTIKELKPLVSGSSITGSGTVKKLTLANSSITFTKGDQVTIEETYVADQALAKAKSELKDAIASVKYVATSTDGADVLTTEKWTTAEAKATLETATADAKKVLDNTNSTIDELKAAKATLAKAVSAYEAAQKIGTKVEFKVTSNDSVANTVDVLGLVGTEAVSGTTSVATVAIKDDKIVITSVKEGKAVITVSDTDEKTTDATFEVTVDATGKITLGTIKKSEQVTPE